MLQIEHNIPIPRPGRKPLYPEVRDMQVGDSVVVPKSPNVTEWARHTGFRFAARLQPDGTYRVWRVENRHG